MWPNRIEIDLPHHTVYYFIQIDAVIRNLENVYKLWLFFLSQTPQSHPLNTKITIIFFLFRCNQFISSSSAPFPFFSLCEAPPPSTIHVDSNTQNRRLDYDFVLLRSMRARFTSHKLRKRKIRSNRNCTDTKEERIFRMPSVFGQIYIFSSLYFQIENWHYVYVSRVCISFTSFAMRLLLISHSLHYAYTLMHTHAYLWVAIAQWRRFFNIFLRRVCECVCAFRSVYAQLHIK